MPKWYQPHLRTTCCILSTNILPESASCCTLCSSCEMSRWNLARIDRRERWAKLSTLEPRADAHALRICRRTPAPWAPIITLARSMMVNVFFTRNEDVKIQIDPRLLASDKTDVRNKRKKHEETTVETKTSSPIGAPNPLDHQETKRTIPSHMDVHGEKPVKVWAGCCSCLVSGTPPSPK